MIDHDRIFKELIKTFFVEFVELFLPDVYVDLDQSSIEFLDKEVFRDFLNHQNPVASALMAKMKMKREERRQLNACDWRLLYDSIRLKWR